MKKTKKQIVLRLGNSSPEINKITRKEYLLRGAILSTAWALLEKLQIQIGEKKSLTEIRKHILVFLGTRYGDKDLDTVQEIKIKAWKMLENNFTEDDQEANIPNIVEAFFFNNFDWFSKIDPSMCRHFDWVSYNLIHPDTTVSLPERSMGVADIFQKNVEKVIFDKLKEEKRERKAVA